MSRPRVILAEKLSPATVEALGSGFEIVQVDGTDRAALKEALASAEAVLIRSATQMDAEALSWGAKLKVVARAGVGLDNVDVAAATQQGVMVVNAPTSNIISAAELTVAHILSLARNIPQADASLSSGKWERSKFSGVELFEKTVGIIGLGRIGGLVAERLRAFGVKIIAFDPYVSAARAQQMNVELCTLEELLKEADFITIHMPKTPETVGMIGAPQFDLMKKTAFVVNVARGGLIDESALLEALDAGKIAGAALDVFVTEPPQNTELIAHPKVNVTPHLGASTSEAQEKAGVSVARSVRLALAGELVPDAVNVAGGAIGEQVRPYLPLTEMLGQILSGVVVESLESLRIEVHGDITAQNVDSLRLAALKGYFTNIVSEPVSYVNAPLFAEQRGVKIEFVTDGEHEAFRSVLRLRGITTSGKTVSVVGAITGVSNVYKLIEVNGYDLELQICPNMIVTSYEDRPGVVAALGSVLGQAGVNIAGMQISRNEQNKRALAVISVDSEVSDEVTQKLAECIDSEFVRTITLHEN